MQLTESKPVRVLLVEDDSVSARLLQANLAQVVTAQFELQRVERLGEALPRLGQERFDIVLLDLSLPDSRGLETFAAVHTQAPAVPIIVLTGIDDDRLALEAIREGAQDYLVKGEADAKTLARVMRYAIERKRVEEVLRESEQRYKHLLESTTDYIYTVMVKDGQVVSTAHGPACLSVTGYTSKEYEADPFLWYQMVHEEDRPAVIAQAAHVLAGKPVAPLEHRLYHKDGSIRWVKNTSVPRKDEQGRVIACDGLISDITERKRVQEERDRFFTLSLDLFCISGYDGYFKQLNPAWEQTLGYSQAELLAAPYREFVHPEDRELTLAEGRELRSGRVITTFENRYRCKDGSYKWLLWNAVPFPEQQLIYAAARDITDRKQAEAQLQQTNADLARSRQALLTALADVRKSHQELKAAQLQLIQAEKMDSVGTLAAGVAHEVKNPLQILLMGVRYLANNLTTQDVKLNTILTDMRVAVGRADTIIRGLLEFSSSNQLLMKSEDLNEAVEQALWLINYELTANGIRLIKGLSPGLPPLKLDKIKMEQVFINIFMNAIQAMPRGGTLTVKTDATPLPQLHPHLLERTGADLKSGDPVVVATIEDTGQGIPLDKLTKIFDPFFTTKPVGKGTGLGLTVVKKIIELHGGLVDVRNRPEGGVRVTLLIKPQPDPIP